MRNHILASCGIKEVSENYEITLTDEVEAEIKALMKCEERNKDIDIFKRCIYCYYNIEAMHDFCEIKQKRILIFDLCDQFKTKMTRKNNKTIKYFEEY